MPVSPDDLLIFKMREGRTQEEPGKKHAKKPAAAVAAKLQAQQQATQVQQRPGGPPAQAQQQAQRISPNEVLKEGKIAAAREVMNRTFVAPAGTYTQVEEALATEGMNVNNYNNKKETKAQITSKEAAVGLSCVWHPWRTAYAVCDYCHRPFCFEDIMEHNGHYYCLEDIDAVSAAAQEAGGQRFSYGRMSFAAGALLVLSFGVFLFFANGQLAQLVGYANSVGFFMFLSNITGPYAFAFLGALVTFFEFVAGIMIFVQSKKGFVMSLALSLVGTLLFSYQFISSGTLYALFVGVASFAAMITVAASTHTMKVAENEDAPAVQQAAMEFPNIGKF